MNPSPVELRGPMSYDHPMKLTHIADLMVALALKSGASDAKVIDPGSMVVNHEFVTYCSTPMCPNYNTSGNCPPHGHSSREFQLALPWYEKAVAFKFDVPVSVLMTDARIPLSRKLHEIAAELERLAKEKGCLMTMGVATGGCKALFCKGHSDCLVLKGEPCRHKELAKPSMSGLGVDFSALSDLAGWTVNKVTAMSSTAQGEMGVLAGFVLIKGKPGM